MQCHFGLVFTLNLCITCFIRLKLGLFESQPNSFSPICGVMLKLEATELLSQSWDQGTVKIFWSSFHWNHEDPTLIKNNPTSSAPPNSTPAEMHADISQSIWFPDVGVFHHCIQHWYVWLECSNAEMPSMKLSTLFSS